MNKKLKGIIDGLIIFIVIFTVIIGTFIIGNLDKFIELIKEVK